MGWHNFKKCLPFILKSIYKYSIWFQFTKNRDEKRRGKGKKTEHMVGRGPLRSSEASKWFATRCARHESEESTLGILIS